MVQDWRPTLLAGDQAEAEHSCGQTCQHPQWEAVLGIHCVAEMARVSPQGRREVLPPYLHERAVMVGVAGVLPGDSLHCYQYSAD